MITFNHRKIRVKFSKIRFKIFNIEPVVSVLILKILEPRICCDSIFSMTAIFYRGFIFLIFYGF